MTITENPVDRAAAEAFAARLGEMFTEGALTYLIDLGHRTGLFAAASEGPATSAELADRARLEERYVREWLGAMATAGIMEFESTESLFWLPTEHAASLVGDSVANLAPIAMLTTMLGRHVPAVAHAFRHGGGVPWANYGPEVYEVMTALWGPWFADVLVSHALPLAPGLSERLATGARAADVACGTGMSLIALGESFPASTFVGYDLDEQGLVQARAEAKRRGLQNVRFERADAAQLVVDEPFDAVFVFNALHDQAEPAAMLARIREALVPGGTLFLNEPRVSSVLAENIDNPLAPLVYAVSTLHCLTVSLAAGGAGLGTAFGEQVAVQMLRDAGFEPVAVHETPADPGNAIFVTRRA